MKIADMPIRRRMMMAILATSIVVIILMRVTFFVYDYFAFKQTTVRQITTLGEITAENSTAALAFQNQSDAHDILAALALDPHIEAACLYDRNGKLFAKFPESLPVSAFPSAPGPKGYSFDHSYLAGFQPVVQGSNDLLGTLYIRLEVRTVMAEWFWTSLKIGLVGMGLILLVAYLISRSLERQISLPILALAETARAVSERKDYSVRAETKGGGELGLLTDAFNHMLAQIEELNRDLEHRVTERTAQLEAANKELEAFSYSVSHDLRAPLRHVDGFAGMLSKHASKTLDDTGRRYITTISGAARQMGRLIDDLLSFSRVSRTELNVSPVDQNALLLGVIRDGRFDRPGREIEWHIAALPRVCADLSMLRQVWSNLLENAVKYSGKKEHPRIDIGSETSADGSEHVFHVRDNGVGFDMQYVEKLFGVFQRLHTSTEFEGTGIGLANIRRIVARHGGRTWAEGVSGEGATFYFTLPVTALEPSAQLAGTGLANSEDNPSRN